MKIRQDGELPRFGVRYWNLFLLSAFALTFVVFSSCGTPTVEHAATMPVVPVSVATVIRRDVPVQVTGIGTVEAYSVVSVKSQVDGELVAVHFTEGQEVKAGSLLFEIDPRPFQAELSRAQANLERDAAQLKQAEANLARDVAQEKNAEVEAQRYQQLVLKGVATKEQYDQFRTNAEALQAAVQADQAAIDNARNTITADQAAVETARIQLGYCSIRSPIDGRTGSVLVKRGNLVKGNDTTLVVINKIHPIYADIPVPEQNLPEIRKYMALGKVKVEAIIPNDPQGPAEGVLTFVDNTVDTTTGTIRLKATFANQDGRLWPGQFVNASMTLTTQPNAVVIPSQAAQTGQQGAFVFVVQPDLTVEARPVTLGRVVGSETVVEKGLQPGEKVVTDGQLRLAPGTKVQVKEPVVAPGTAS